MKKLLFFTGDIETQGYFSKQIAEAMKGLGHETFIYDLSKPWESTEKFFRFFEQDNTALINFNFHGMSGEQYFLDENDTLMWEALRIPSYNIVVDHPMYYHHFWKRFPHTIIISALTKTTRYICADFFRKLRTDHFCRSQARNCIRTNPMYRLPAVSMM